MIPDVIGFSLVFIYCLEEVHMTERSVRLVRCAEHRADSPGLVTRERLSNLRSFSVGSARLQFSGGMWRRLALSLAPTLIVLLSLAAFSVISVVSYLILALLSVTISFRVYKSVIQAVQKSREGHPFKWVEASLVMLYNLGKGLQRLVRSKSRPD